ncbi:MAG: anti-sigma factor [Anaerolineae bacterium]
MTATGHTSHDCEKILDLIPDYAFGLTSADDSRRVEAALPGCPEAAAQLASFEGLQDDMRASVAQHQPPPALRDRILAAAQVSSPTPARAAGTIARQRALMIGWIAAAAAAIALVVTNVYWINRTRDLTRQQDDLIRTLNAINGGNGGFVLTSTDQLRWVRIPSEADSERVAFMMWNGDSRTGLLYVHAFPELQAGDAYQLWLTRPNEEISAGTFRVDDQGNAAYLFDAPDAIDDFSWAWVTTEPETGSAQPSDRVMVHGRLTE